jgi:hypothetical protein
MLFAFPYALAGLATVAGLVAIYTFRARFRRRPVSSLMLWRQTLRPRQGGAHRERLRLPPLFYLELAALTALVLAALGPRIRRPGAGSLTVVFDNSASMSARDDAGHTAQARAARALQTAVRKVRYARVRLLLAGAEGPENAGHLPPSRAAARLLQTPCRGAGDSLSSALAHAGDLSEPADDILVLTDRAPDTGAPLRSGVRWIACGAPRPNAAITLAERTWLGTGQETLLIEVTGFGHAAPEVTLRMSLLDGGAPIFEGSVALGADGRGRQRLELPPETPALAVELPPDALAIDNRAVLVPERPRPLAVAVHLDDAALRRLVERALTATGRVVLNAEAPQLVFTERILETAGPAAPWQFVVTRPVSPRLLRGPCFADRAHPLLEGVSFEGLVWPAGANTLPGRVLLFSGSAPLLSLDMPLRGATFIHLVSAGAGDALYRSAAWPALVWNTVQACADAQPGPVARNLRAGATARFATERQASEARFETPEGEQRLRARAGRATWAPTLPGRYHLLLDDGRREAFAVNFLAPGESDLRRRRGGQWGGAQETARLRRTHRSVAWIAGVAALLLAGVHHGVLGQWSRRGSEPPGKRIPPS